MDRKSWGLDLYFAIGFESFCMFIGSKLTYGVSVMCFSCIFLWLESHFVESETISMDRQERERERLLNWCEPISENWTPWERRTDPEDDGNRASVGGVQGSGNELRNITIWIIWGNIECKLRVWNIYNSVWHVRFWWLMSDNENIQTTVFYSPHWYVDCWATILVRNLTIY